MNCTSLSAVCKQQRTRTLMKSGSAESNSMPSDQFGIESAWAMASQVYHVPDAQNFPAREAGSAMKGVRHATSAKTVKTHELPSSSASRTQIPGLQN
jgi:hypothetical protein